MRKDLLNLLIVMLLSSAVAAATNALGHRMEWIRRPLPSPANGKNSTSSPAGAATSQVAAGNHAPGNGIATTQRPGFVNMEELLSCLTAGTVRVIDARENNDYAAGHLRGAIHIPSSDIFPNIERVTSQVSADDFIIVYCGGDECEASRNVADALRRDYGFTNVNIYEKGWEEITSSGRFTQWISSGDQP